jgi:hypothetical protein
VPTSAASALAEAIGARLVVICVCPCGGPDGASALWPVPEAERSPGHRGGETVLPGPRP